MLKIQSDNLNKEREFEIKMEELAMKREELALKREEMAAKLIQTQAKVEMEVYQPDSVQMEIEEN
jgi:hypothetical protein